MNKKNALRLKPGDKVKVEDGKPGFEGSYAAVGEVVHVTPKGGVLVAINEGKLYGSNDWEGPGTGPGAGEERWFPYSQIRQYK